MLRFENEGLSLAYEVHGTGSPVVMLHGAAVSFAGNFAACGWIDRMTARSLQVIGLDLRGHGQSDKPHDPEAYGIEVSSRDVIALIDHLGLERVSVVGYSIGSTIAIHALHSYPDRFRAGALVATGDGIVGYPPLMFPVLLPPLVEVLNRAVYPDDVPTHVATYWTFAEQVAGDRAGIAAFSGGEYPPCSIEEAGSVEAPVLVVSGDQDVVLGTGARLAAALRKGRYLEVAGANHFMLAVDESVQKMVADFIAAAG